MPQIKLMIASVLFLIWLMSAVILTFKLSAWKRRSAISFKVQMPQTRRFHFEKLLQSSTKNVKLSALQRPT